MYSIKGLQLGRVDVDKASISRRKNASQALLGVNKVRKSLRPVWQPYFRPICVCPENAYVWQGLYGALENAFAHHRTMAQN